MIAIVGVSLLTRAPSAEVQATHDAVINELRQTGY
jgi:hypothetical protein